jgi:hypothetical protein
LSIPSYLSVGHLDCYSMSRVLDHSASPLLQAEISDAALLLGLSVMLPRHMSSARAPS